MLLAIISDIHANLPALREVLRKLDDVQPDKVICLGDFVGYGPQPNEVIDIIRERGYDSVLGNHDAAVAGKLTLSAFREPNRDLLKKTTEVLTDSNREWLGSLPMKLHGDNWVAAHASPLEADSWPYLNNAIKCRETLEAIDADLCFVGHTHRPGIVSNKFGILTLQKGSRFVVNPGAVGQSRNEDKRSTFCTVNTETFEHKLHRCSYEFGETLSHYTALGINRETGKQLLHLDRVF